MAFFKGSYYENLPGFDAVDGAKPAFRGVRPRPVANPEPILEHAVATGDRLDRLGHEYYANPRDWRRVADCNAGTLFAEDLLYGPDPNPDADDHAQEAMGEPVLIPRRRDGGV